MGEPLRSGDFRRLWVASTVGYVGFAVSVVAVDVLLVNELRATETQVGLVRAAQYLPYLLLGLVAGALVDRWRRRPTIVVANLAGACLLLVVPVLVALDLLTVGALAAILFAVGAAVVFGVAAEQSYLPDLVPRRELVLANARLGQSMAVGQTAGPALGGGLAGLVGSSVALLGTAAGQVLSAVLVWRIRRPEPPVVAGPPAVMGRDVLEGLRFTYGHRLLTPLACSTHVWFVANGAGLVVLGLFALRSLGLSPAAYGVVLGLAGVGALTGALVAPAAAVRLGEGHAVIAGRSLCAIAWLALALTPDAGPAVLVAWLGAAQLLHGLGMGLEEPSEMGFRQAVTPRRLLGRVSATYRSANRSAAAAGALLGGVLAGAAGHRATLVAVAAVFAVAAAVAALSPLRGARAGLDEEGDP